MEGAAMAPTRKILTTSVRAALLRHPDDEGTGDGAGDGTGDGAGDALGDAGRRALDEERKARRQAERTARDAQTQLTTLQQQVEELTRKSMTDQERQVAEQLEAKSVELRAEIEAQANARVAAAEAKVLAARLKSVAAGKLQNPADVAVFVNADDLERDAQGDVSDDALAAAVDALLKERPYLGAKPGGGSADQGHRRDAAPDLTDRKQLAESMARFGLRPRS
jgi:TolA-binding protein